MAIPWAGQLQRVAVWQCGRPLTRLSTSLNSVSLRFTPGSPHCASLWLALPRFGWLIAEGRITFAGEKTTMGIWYSGFGIGNSQLATGNLQPRWAFLFLQILFNYFCSWIRSRTQRWRAWVQSASRRAVPSHCCAAAPIIIIFAVAVVLLDIRLVIYFG